ncbi:unnamed protein product [Leptidea sinapis]|uniref:Secreted protein n=1 Tax=Leptidea sinapis TaxID=189913 RepID=A0A5E4QRS4_9NEOP|nr:unnamed protein product [Leptidea sinapis]
MDNKRRAGPSILTFWIFLLQLKSSGSRTVAAVGSAETPTTWPCRDLMRQGACTGRESSANITVSDRK